MATYYVWSGATGSATGADWTNAWTSVSSLPATLSSGDIVKIHTGSTSPHNESAAAVLTITGPGNNECAYVVGVDKDNSDAYTVSSGTNITTTGSNNINLYGCLAVYGIKIKSGNRFSWDADANEYFHMEDGEVDAQAQYSLGTGGRSTFTNVDFIFGTSGYFDSSTTNTDLTIIGGAITGSNSYLLNIKNGNVTFIGVDMSGHSCTTWSGTYGNVNLIGCAYPSSASYPSTNALQFNLYGTDTDASNLVYRSEHTTCLDGLVALSGTVYRDSGATYDGTNEYSIKMSAATLASIARPLYTEWQTGYVAADSGTQTTWTVYIANTSADIYDDDCWLEVEYYGSASHTQKTVISGRLSDILATHNLITDDTTSTWTGITEFAQKLALTATVGRAGMYRWRVASTFTTADVYVCPKADVVQA